MEHHLEGEYIHPLLPWKEESILEIFFPHAPLLLLSPNVSWGGGLGSRIGKTDNKHFIPREVSREMIGYFEK